MKLILHRSIILHPNPISATARTNRSYISSSIHREEAEKRKIELRVCTNRSCRRQGSLDSLQVLSGIAPPHVAVTSCGCLGKCGTGPNLVVLPGAVFIKHCHTPARAAETMSFFCLDRNYNDIENECRKCLEALELRKAAEDEMAKGDFSNAYHLLSQAIDLKPFGGIHISYRNRSVARLAMGDSAEALLDANEALSIAPSYSDVPNIGIRASPLLEIGFEVRLLQSFRFRVKTRSKMENRFDAWQQEMRAMMTNFATTMKEQIQSNIEASIAAMMEQVPSRRNSRSSHRRASNSSQMRTKSPSGSRTSSSANSSLPRLTRSREEASCSQMSSQTASSQVVSSQSRTTPHNSSPKSLQTASPSSRPRTTSPYSHSRTDSLSSHSQTISSSPTLLSESQESSNPRKPLSEDASTDNYDEHKEQFTIAAGPEASVLDNVSPVMAVETHLFAQSPSKGLECTWSSRSDGDVGVSISMTRKSVAPVPTGTLPRGQLMNGTSMSSHSAWGAVGLLISGKKTEGIFVNLNSAWKALENTNTLVGSLQEEKLIYGEGLLQVKRAYEYTQKSKHFPWVWYQVKINQAAVSTPTSQVMYLKGTNASNRSTEGAVEIPPKFQGDASSLEQMGPYEESIQWYDIGGKMDARSWEGFQVKTGGTKDKTSASDFMDLTVVDVEGQGQALLGADIVLVLSAWENEGVGIDPQTNAIERSLGTHSDVKVGMAVKGCKLVLFAMWDSSGSGLRWANVLALEGIVESS